MPASPPTDRASRLALLALALCAGWVARDLGMFVLSGRPENALDVLPASVVVVVVGGVLGLVLGRAPLLWVPAFLACAVGIAWPLLGDARWARNEIWGPRIGFVMLATALVADLVERRFRLGVLRTGFAAGILACAVKTVARHDTRPMTEAFVVAGVLLLALGLLRRPLARRGLTALVLAGFVALFVPQTLRDLRPTRSDLPPPEAAAPADAPSMLVVVLDTVRADHLSLYGNEHETSPNLDAFGRDEATVYTQARSTSPFTLPAHGSLFTGLFPSEHHAARPGASARPLREDVPTLAERLRAEGYQTAAIVANDTYVSPDFGMDRGFEHFDDRAGGWVGDYLSLSQLTGVGLRTGHLSHREAPEITDLALRWLDGERRDGPFFLFLNYLDAHSPYHPPGDYARLFGDEQPTDPLSPEGPLRALLYDREIAFLDSQVGRLLDGLRERGLFDPLWIVVTADHGDDFLEHGIVEHCWNLYDSLVHVPLLVKPAGGRTRPLDERRIGLAGVHDLLLEGLGLEVERPDPGHGGFVGEWYPCVPVNEAYDPWAERYSIDVDADRVAWIEEGVKWIVDSGGTVEAFDLEADPQERHPLALEPAAEDAARARARAWWQARPLPAEDERAPDPERMKRLKALGYG